MLRPRLTISQPRNNPRSIHLTDVTGDYHALRNPYGFGSPNAEREQIRATIAIHRATDNSELLAEQEVPANLFLTGKTYSIPLPLADAICVVTTRLYSRYGQPAVIADYILPARNYVEGLRLSVFRDLAWIDVTGDAHITAGTIEWSALRTADIYRLWRLTDTDGNTVTQGALLPTNVSQSDTLTMTGETEELCGVGSQYFLADADIRKKVAGKALDIAFDKIGSFPSASLMGGWGKLYLEYEELKLLVEDSVPAIVDAKLARLHRLADRLVL